jgi:hypothetical protein
MPSEDSSEIVVFDAVVPEVLDTILAGPGAASYGQDPNEFLGGPTDDDNDRLTVHHQTRALSLSLGRASGWSRPSRSPVIVPQKRYIGRSKTLLLMGFSRK